MKYKCPECSKEFANPKAIGPHRARVHGYVAKRPSTNPGANRMAAAVKHAGSFPCPHCDFVASWSGGLTKHMGAKHPEAKSIDTSHGATKYRKSRRSEIVKATQDVAAHGATNGHFQVREEGHFDSDGIAETTLALALGRFQGLCTAFATEFDLPPKRFASRFAELIYRTRA